MTDLPFTLETATERAIAADPAWQRGVAWGKPRPGHLEGQVMYHIADVLANLDRQHLDPTERRRLRLLALAHDTFKYAVDSSRPAVGDNHHAAIAATWAQRYIDDPALLRLLREHDEAYHAWRIGARTGNWARAEQCAEQLLERIGSDVSLYVHFYRADNATASKEQAPVRWFEDFLMRRGVAVDGTPLAR